MSLHIDIKKDPFYQKGKKEGIEKGEQKKASVFVTNLLQNTDFPDEKIAALAGVTIEYVGEIRKELEKTKL